MILRFLNIQGIAGLAVSAALAILLVIQKVDTHHWKKQSASLERLYRNEQSAFATIVADTRAAADRARAADEANAARVAAEQRGITERTRNDFEARLAAVRVRAERLRVQSETAADFGARRNASLPGVSAAAGRAAQAPREGRLPSNDALIATEQAIQLDELIKWVRAQARVDNNRTSVASPSGD